MLLTIALAFAALAAALHVYIFVLESFLWTAPRTRAVFGMSAEQAAMTKQLAYNQGFYNLFLAVTVLAGIVLRGGQRNVGVALVVAGTLSMLGAALVLVVNDPAKARAAITQGALPAASLAVLTIWALQT